MLAHKDMSEVLLASKSLLHVDTNHRNLYSNLFNITQNNVQQWQGVGNDPEPLGVAFSPRPFMYILASLTVLN